MAMFNGRQILFSPNLPLADENYNPKSSNAQSGKAVAEAINDILRYITYSIANSEVTITSCDTSISGSYEIPEKIEGYPVTAISAGAFMNCRHLKDITLPRNVGVIAQNTFKGCSSLKSISHSFVAGEVNLTIEANAFQNCSALADVYYLYYPNTEIISTSISSSGNLKYTTATKHNHQAPAKVQDIYDYHDNTKQNAWRKIIDVTLTAEDEARAIIFEVDYNNLPFVLSKARIYVVCPANSELSGDQVGYISIKSSYQTTYLDYGSVYFISPTRDYVTTAEIITSDIMPTQVQFSAQKWYQASKNTSVNAAVGESEGMHKQIEGIRLKLNANSFMAGTRIIIEGVDK